jgi:hypothetical protein
MVECQRHGMRVKTAFFECDRREPVRSSALESEPECGTAIGGTSAVAQQDECGVGLAREVCKSQRDGAGENRGVVEDDERERATPEQEVGAPRGAGGVWGADHPRGVDSRGGDGPGVEGSARINPRSPRSAAFCTKCCKKQLSGDGCEAGSGCAEPFGELAAGDSAVGENGIDGRDVGWKSSPVGLDARDDGGDLEFECCKRHIRINTEEKGVIFTE